MTPWQGLFPSGMGYAAYQLALDGGFAFTDVGADVLPEEMQGKGVDSRRAW